MSGRSRTVGEQVAWCVVGLAAFAGALFTIAIGVMGAGHGGPWLDGLSSQSLLFAAVTLLLGWGGVACFRAAVRARRPADKSES